jgi:hypothetical protein
VKALSSSPSTGKTKTKTKIGLFGKFNYNLSNPDFSGSLDNNLP